MGDFPPDTPAQTHAVCTAVIGVMVHIASWYHLSVKPVSRSAGRSVVAAAAYRLGARIEDQRAQLVHDYRRKSGIEATFTVAPADAPAWAFEPERLWNAAELAERRVNSTLAREVELALPMAVSPQTRQQITETFAHELVERYGVAVSVAIHLPGHGGDQRNHHAHILFTTREMTEDGLGAKTRILDDRSTGPKEVSYLREYACDLINAALEDAGSDERIDHRSFAARGIDQEPTQHLGPTATEMERRGEVSELGEENRAIAERNAERQKLDELVEDLAALDRQIAEELDAEFLDEPPIFASEASTASPAEVVEPAPSDFDHVHAETMQAATIEQAQMLEEPQRPESRFERVRSWWHNVCQHFVDWRDELRERAQAYGLPWEAEARGVARGQGEEGPSVEGDEGWAKPIAPEQEP